ncbi:MAG: hypothetical protein Q9222_003086 [Ikaeria aurantiellina]
MAPTAAASGTYDAALNRRRALMGDSGPAALVQNLRVFGIACFACIGGLLYGYNQGVFSGILTMNDFMDHMGNYDSNDPADQTRKGWLTSILELGAWVGTLLSGFLAEQYSRKYTIIIATTVFVVGVIVQSCAVQAGHNAILGGRFVTGMGVGSLSMIVPMYNAEVAPPEIRGALISLQQFAIEFGIMISFWIDYGTNYIGGTGQTQSEAAWLVPICLQLAPALILFGGMLMMPFSPRWLIHHDREDEARKVLARLRGLTADHELVDLEFLEIKAQSSFEKRTVAEKFPHLQTPSAWNTFKLQFVAIASLFRTMPMFRRVIVATVTMFFQQWTGINAILYYAPTIFSNLGLGNNTVSLLATGVVGVVMLLATIPTLFYIDKLGRRPILAVGALGMATCHIIIAVIVAKDQNSWASHSAAGWGAVAMVWLFVVHFGYSWGPCAWILVAEVWPMSNRPYGIALGASSNWMNNFIVGQVTPDMLSGITYGTYLVFGILTFMGAAFIWFYVPETKRLTLEEMDVVFGSDTTAQADFARMEAVNRDVGLKSALGDADGGSDYSGEKKARAEEMTA